MQSLMKKRRIWDCIIVKTFAYIVLSSDNDASFTAIYSVYLSIYKIGYDPSHHVTDATHKENQN